MKKSLAIAAVVSLAASGAFAQVDLSDFQSAFEGFAGDMAGALAVNSTIGSNWSDAYIGKFPHFGVGATAGAAFASSASAKTLFEATGGTLPSELENLGIPIPAAVITAKIGIPFLPIDIGLKGGYIPEPVGKAINASSGMTVDYKNIGVQIRYAIVKQNVVLPNISIGAAYNYQEGNIVAPSGIGSQTFNVTTDQGPTTISATDPEVKLNWSSNIFDFTLQVSKQLLFIIPYAGVGYSIGTSKVDGGVSSTLGSTYASGTYGNGIAGLNSFFAANGGPTIGDQGFTYSADAKSPVFRVYGGLSLRILVDLDIQAMYVPATKALGGSATIRIQL
jgi:hypothetical protein